MRPSRTAASAGLASVRGVDVPLVGQEGLDGDLGAVAVRDHVGLGVDAVEPALLLGEGHDELAGLVAVEAVEVGELVGGVDALARRRRCP